MKKWKLFFGSLLAANILVVGLLLIIVFQPSPTQDRQKSDKAIVDGVELDIQTNKKDLTQLINYYLRKESRNQRVNYEVFLADEVQLIGELPVFEKTINMVLAFEPEVQKNGDVTLRQKSISLGELQLPVFIVLKYIKDNYKMPEWVIINPEEQTVYVALQKMKLKSDFRVKVKTFNLQQDEIIFQLVVPTS